MNNIGYTNLLSIVTGVLIILTGSLVTYFFQKNLFNKYRNKVGNAMNKNKPARK